MATSWRASATSRERHRAGGGASGALARCSSTMATCQGLRSLAQQEQVRSGPADRSPGSQAVQHPRTPGQALVQQPGWQPGTAGRGTEGPGAWRACTAGGRGTATRGHHATPARGGRRAPSVNEKCRHTRHRSRTGAGVVSGPRGWARVGGWAPWAGADVGGERYSCTVLSVVYTVGRGHSTGSRQTTDDTGARARESKADRR